MKIRIAENIKNLRKNRSLTQEQLAEALGVTMGAVYKWEAGLSMPEIKLLMEIADLFGVSVDALLGYEQQNNNIENIVARIKQYMLEKNFEEAITESRKALKKYPNSFDIVYISALMYQLEFTEDKNENAIEKSNELFRQTISLLYQNTHEHINKVTISNHIAENYLRSGKTEQALESLKQNNVCGNNDSLIGFIYAQKLKQPQQAKPYLIKSFADTLNNIIRTTAGLAYMYAEMNDESGMDTVLWINDFLDNLKINSDSITFTDKIKAAALAQYAVWKATSGDFDVSIEYLKKSFLLAKKFDSAPVYSLEGIKFFREESTVVYDEIGKTATEAVQNIIFNEAEESEAYKFVRKAWTNLENSETK